MRLTVSVPALLSPGAHAEPASGAAAGQRGVADLIVTAIESNNALAR
ncbi:hypothetical protein AB0I35_06930 [Nocardia sp. NPDC050378]